MSYSENSAQAYASLGTIPPKQHEIYRLLRAVGSETAGYSNRQIAQILKRPINTVTPRVLELRELGLVELAGKRKDLLSGITVNHWRINPERA